MIRPVLSGAALLDQIAATQPDAGEIAVWWLGQSGYALKTVSMLWYTDLYLSDHLTAKYANTEMPHIRMTEAPLQGPDLKDARWIFSSHRHSDHLDPGTLPAVFAASSEAHLILPNPVIEYAAGLGLPRDRLIPAHGDQSLQIGTMTVHCIPAAHPDLAYDEAVGYPFLGYVFEVDGLRVYFSGDTLVYDGLAERLRAFDLDLGFLPINGTSPRLQALRVPPNMNAEEAVALAQAASIRHVIPHHYDMFTFNTADAADFAALAHAAGLPYHILRPGERFLLRLADQGSG